MKIVRLEAAGSVYRIGTTKDDANSQQYAKLARDVAKGANDMSRNSGEAASAANDMSRNASEAAYAVGDTSANMHGVSQAARDNTTSALHVNFAAQRLAAIATQLEQLVGQFKI